MSDKGQEPGSDIHVSDLKAKKGVPQKLAEKVVELFLVMKAPATPFAVKAKAAGALAYFILPIDIVPDLIPILGYADDIAVVTMTYNMLKNHVTPEIEKQAAELVERLFHYGRRTIFAKQG